MSEAVKVGQRVRLLDSYRDYLLKEIRTHYGIGAHDSGVYRFDGEGEYEQLAVLFMCREFEQKIYGKVIEQRSYGSFEVAFETPYGSFGEIVERKHVAFVSRKCKTCKRKF